MAVNIGPKIGVDGEAEYRKQISNVIQQAKELSSEMKMVTSAFDKNDKSQDKLSAQMEVLTKQLQNQTSRIDLISKKYASNQKRLDELRKALTETIKEYGEESKEAEKASNAIRNQEKELSKTRTEYNNAVTALNKMNREMEELSNTSNDASDGITDIASAAQTSTSGISAMAVTIGNLAAQAISSAIGAIKDFATSIWNLDETTEEFRRAQGRLNTAFEAAGYGADTAQEAYTGFYKILGDTDTATEASQLLAQLAENEKDISTWTQIAAGVAGTFGDSLPIEGLIEASNETAKVGEVTGSLADALNWVGISEDTFNEKLAACSTESERNRLIMETLAGQYDQASESFYRNNEALIASRENQAQMDESLSTLGENIAQLKAELAPVFQEILNGFVALTENVDWEGFGSAIAGFVRAIVDNGPTIISVISGIAAGFVAWNVASMIQGVIAAVTTLGGVLPAISAGIHAINIALNANPIGLIITLIAGLVTALMTLWNTNDGFREGVIGAWEAVKSALGTAISAIGDALSWLWEQIKKSFSNIVNTVKNIYSSVSSFVKNIEEAIVNGISKAVDFITELPGKALQWGKDFIGGLIDGIKSMINGVKDAVKGIADKIASFLHFSRPDVGPLREYEKWMPDMIDGMAEGIYKNAYKLENAVGSLSAGMEMQVGGMAAGSGAGNTFSITVNAAPGMSEEQVADLVMQRMQHMVRQREAVFA